MADGGTYRFRRYGQFDVETSTGTLTALPHAPYLQESTINPLNGGVERHFDPLTEEFAADPLLRSLLLTMAALFTAVDGTTDWNIKLHPYMDGAQGDTPRQGLDTAPSGLVPALRRGRIVRAQREDFPARRGRHGVHALRDPLRSHPHLHPGRGPFGARGRDQQTVGQRAEGGAQRTQSDEPVRHRLLGGVQQQRERRLR